MIATYPLILPTSMKNLYKVYDSGRERETFTDAISLTQRLQCQVLLQQSLEITIIPLLGSNSLLFFSRNP